MRARFGPCPALCAAFLLLLAATIAGAQPAAPEAENEPGLPFEVGPLVAAMGENELAEIEVPEGFLFLGRDGTRQLMELTENPVGETEVATVLPEEGDWFVVFEWDPIGWVDDSDRDDLDPDGLLASIREGTARANEERARRGWTTFDIVGWNEEPHYDERTHNLTWSVEGRVEGETVLNRSVKLLGRRGVMTAVLVAGPEEMAEASRTTDALLAGYRFRPGHTYAEYLPGTDRIAEVGLAALVVGGAGAALVKSGLLARFWKVLVVAGVAVAGVAKRLLFGPKHIKEPPQVG